MNRKLQLMSKLMVIILLACYTQNGVFAQLAFRDNVGKENRDVKKRSLKSVLLDFQNQYEVSISFQDKHVEGETVLAEIQYYANEEEALSNLLKPLGLKYEKIKEGVYVIPRKDDSPSKEKERKMAKANRLGNVPNTMFQDITVNGKVTSLENGEVLPGVSVLIKGTTTGTVTDISGNYTINAPEDGVLVFSFIGYKTKEVPVSSRSEIDVTLVTDIQSLDELVVVGYGKQKEVNIIGSVTSISSEDIEGIPVPNASNALAGRLPGLIAQQTSGEPGHNAANLLIRGKATFGNNNPLVVINGIQGRDLNSVNPGDIESISVLKDASAAIYGANAANGVILITTKSGREDTAPTFTYDIYRGFKSPTMLPEMADAATYATMIRETQLYRGISEENMAYSPEDIEKFKSGEYSWTHPNTDWYEVALSDYAPTWSHNFSVYGGTSNINYYGSVSTTSEGGIYTHSATSFKRVNVNVKADMDINEYLNVGINISGSNANRNRSITSAQSIYSTLVRMLPTQHAIYPGTDKPGMDLEYGLQPVISPSFAPGFDKDKQYTSYNLLSADLKVPGVEGLSLGGYYAYDRYFTKRKRFEKPFKLYSFDESSYLNAGNTGNEDGSDFLIPVQRGDVGEPHLTDDLSTSERSTLNIKLNYDRSIHGTHNVSAFVAYEQHQYDGEGIQAFRRFFKSDRLPYLFAGGDAEKDNGGWVDIDGSVSYIARLDYNYQETYLLQLGFRKDGSFRFSEDHRWGSFPSILIGWRPSQYNWWEDHFGLIDEFKLKASWGEMGNDQVPAWQYLSAFEFGTGVAFGGSRAYSTALYQSNTPNSFITWETASVYNVGWEMTLLDYRLTFAADLFYERRSDILIQRDASVPEFSGLELPDENFGIVENKGLEVVLGYRKVQPGFSYGVNANFTFVRNNIIEMDEPAQNVSWQVQTGHPMGAALVYRSAGIFRDDEHVNSLPHVPGARPGDIIIEDYDGDSEITPDDRLLLHQTTIPEITYGVSFNLSYKNWALSGLIQGVGRTMKRMYQETRQGQSGNYFQYDAEGRWTPDNINASKPRTFIREEEYWRGAFITDYMYRESDFGRLKNLSLSYTLPENILNVIHMKEAQIYLSGRNLFLIYSENEMIDPEAESAITYPLMRVFSVGGKFTF